MALNTGQVTAGTSAVKLVDGSGQPGREENTSKVWVTNGAAAVAVGGSGVSMTNGLLLAANQTVGPLQLGAGESLYAVCATSSTVSWLQTRV